MGKKLLFEIIKEMSLHELAEYLCRMKCDGLLPCDHVCSEDCPRAFDECRKTLLEEWEDHKPAAEPKTKPVSDSYMLDDTRYIFKGKVNFCFNRPGARDIDYSVMVYGVADTPPMQEAREAIRKRNCHLCGKYSDCDDVHKAMCKVTITRYKKLDDK